MATTISLNNGGRKMGNSMYENHCLRCNHVVYQVDKIGPLKDFTFFHQGCFKCANCGTKLTLKTYYNNQQDNDDKEVYCQSHVPKTGPGKLDGLSVGIKQALNIPKPNHLVNDQIRGSGKGTFDVEALGIKTALSTPKPYEPEQHRNRENMAGRFDASALHIQHGINATKLQRNYKNAADEAKIEEFLDEETQRKLEMRHRAEEDALYRQFAKKRAEEEVTISQQIQEEWEKELERLTSRFQHEISMKKSRKFSSDEEKAMTLRLQREKQDLEKNMTIKLDRKKESLTRKLLEQERQATAELVDKQSKEMMSLISEKLVEYHQNLEPIDDRRLINEEINTTIYPSQAPPPCPPSISKAEIYTDPKVFTHIDEVAINVAREDQHTFTDLVRLLISPCNNDIEKARAIFRWITVKNLNTMQFDDNVNADTPMGILRGIKHGTESYHVLFKRLCSYAGLHCVVIKGYSKSAGYQPGIRFEDNRFRNSWNAVYVAGGWRFVQCNWGARHLVNAKEVPRPGSVAKGGKSDSLRYEYDDHYFLTDPREFIYEFYPLQHEWQLLKHPLTLIEFEELPFVRSLFFRYQLYFPDDKDTKAVLHTDSSGAGNVRIGMPTRMSPSLIFHYNLKFCGESGSEAAGSDTFEGCSLKRYVMQSVSNNIVSFRIHAPTYGQFIMDIFANATTPREYLTGEPMKFKSVCKFKILCSRLDTVMVPLPDCASGEWGPMKATRLFGLIALTHQEALIFASGSTVEIQFRMSRPLTDFMASLHKNGVEEKKLLKYVSTFVQDDIVTFFCKFPDDGQYGLDIYTREVALGERERSSNGSNGHHHEKQFLTHCCKYLINVNTKRI
ncbi:hillarin [Tetranychus urticae]|uniref:LIM zinc-binding domain-containing protein n=1 Tax=Tetranychus urticae TaxID=32264 RepID=T1K1P3_TETUR|nr:hillarin [Tetranychus urticae]